MKFKISFFIILVVQMVVMSLTGEIRNLRENTDTKHVALHHKPIRVGFDSSTAGAVKPHIDFGKIPLNFIGNTGQADKKAHVSNH